MTHAEKRFKTLPKSEKSSNGNGVRLFLNPLFGSVGLHYENNGKGFSIHYRKKDKSFKKFFHDSEGMAQASKEEIKQFKSDAVRCLLKDPNGLSRIFAMGLPDKPVDEVKK